MNELIYQQGGTLYLDEPWDAQPSAATITLATLSNDTLDTIDATFTDITDEDATFVSDLVITLDAHNKGAKVLTGIGTFTADDPDDMTAPGYKLLINRGGRRYFVHPDEADWIDTAVTLRVDAGIDFPIQPGDLAYGVRITYDVDWSTVTDDFVGRVKAEWKVTVGGVVHKRIKIYDVLKQTISRPATWADVLARRPDADTQMSEVRDKEQLVITAWEDIITTMYNMGIRHNLVVPDYSTVLRDATVLQCLYNMTLHQSLPVPSAYEGFGGDYIDKLDREKNAILGQFLPAIDDNEDGSISKRETGINRRSVWFRSPTNHRLTTD